MSEADFDRSYHLDIAPLQSRSSAMSNAKRMEYAEQLMKLYHPGKAAITPEFVEMIKEAAANALRDLTVSALYNTFVKLWNNTIGWVLPMLPRTDKGEAKFYADCIRLLFEILLYVFGGAIILLLFKGASKIKKFFAPLFRLISKIPGVKTLEKGAVNSWRFVAENLKKAVEYLKSAGPKTIDSINKNFESGMEKVFGAI